MRTLENLTFRQPGVTAKNRVIGKHYRTTADLLAGNHQLGHSGISDRAGENLFL
jgi:hypothetical protein